VLRVRDELALGQWSCSTSYLGDHPLIMEFATERDQCAEEVVNRLRRLEVRQCEEPGMRRNDLLRDRAGSSVEEDHFLSFDDLVLVDYRDGIWGIWWTW